jgi:hypothetical protein
MTAKYERMGNDLSYFAPLSDEHDNSLLVYNAVITDSGVDADNPKRNNLLSVPGWWHFNDNAYEQTRADSKVIS